MFPSEPFIHCILWVTVDDIGLKCYDIRFFIPPKLKKMKNIQCCPKRLGTCFSLLFNLFQTFFGTLVHSFYLPIIGPLESSLDETPNSFVLFFTISSIIFCKTLSSTLFWHWFQVPLVGESIIYILLTTSATDKKFL